MFKKKIIFLVFAALAFHSLHAQILTSSGGGGSYSIPSYPGNFTNYYDGFSVIFRANHANPGGATMNIAGLGPINISNTAGNPLSANDILNGQIVTLVYDASATRFQMITTSGNVSGGASTGWSTIGNTGTVDGTHFIGTTDAVPFNIKVNNQKAGRIESSAGAANTFYGYQTGNANTGTFNTATGYQALTSNVGGNYNTATGYAALGSNTTGGYNTAGGVGALFSNVAGSHATAFGYYAMRYSNDQAGAFTNQNVAVGYEALRGSGTASANTGNANTAVGYQTLVSNAAGFSNTALGFQTLYFNTGGGNNTAIGYGALNANTSGSHNTALGFQAGYTAVAGNANTTGSYNVFLGYNAGPGSATQLDNAIAIGKNALVNASNSMVLGGTGADAVNVGIGVTAPTAKLEVAGQVKITGGGPAAGAVLTSDATGLATWQMPAAGGSITGGGTASYVPRWTTASQLGNSVMWDDGTNIGIGSTSPSAKLHVQRTLADGFPGILVENTNGTGEAILQLKTNSGDFLELYKGGPTASGSINGIPLANLSYLSTGVNAGPLMLRTVVGHPIYFLTNNLTRMILSSTGDLGIGTTIPQNKLDIFSNSTSSAGTGQLRLSNGNDYTYFNSFNDLAGNSMLDINQMPASGTDNVQVRLFRKTTTTGSVYFSIHDGTGAATQANVALSGNSNSFINVNTGNVGIGNTAAAEKLDVTGNVQFSGALMPNSDAGTSGQALVSQGMATAPVWQNIPATLPAGSASQTVHYNGGWVASSFLWNTGTEIGINTTAPLLKLDARGASAKAVTAFENIFEAASSDAASPLTVRVGLQTHATATSRYGSIEVDDAGTKRPLYLQPNGGNVSIGALSGTGGSFSVNGPSASFNNPAGAMGVSISGTVLDASVLSVDGPVLANATGPSTNAMLALKDGHIQSQQSAGSPTTIAAGAALAGGTFSLSNATDVAGRVTFNPTTTTSTAGAMVIISFGKPYAVAPIVILTPANNNAGNASTHGVYIATPASTTGFTISMMIDPDSAPICSGVNNIFNYYVIETQ